MRWDPSKDIDDYYFYVIKNPHDTPDTLWDESVAKMKDWRKIRDNVDIYNQSLGYICFPVYNRLTILGTLARAWRSPYCRCKCPHCQGDAYFIPDKYQDLVLPRNYDVPPWQEKWEDFYKVRESIQFKCSHCGKTSHKDVSKDKYIDQHLKFGKLLWTYDTKKTCATGSPKEKFNDSLWEDEPYQIEGASRETLIGIIRNYTKFGHIIYAHEEEDNLSIKRLKEIIKVCEEENR